MKGPCLHKEKQRKENRKWWRVVCVCGLRILAGLVLHTSQPQTLGRTMGSFRNIASALTHSVDMLYCLLRRILKRQYRKVDSPIHYKASRITFSWDTAELWEIQYTVFLGMETVWPRLANSQRILMYLLTAKTVQYTKGGFCDKQREFSCLKFIGQVLIHNHADSKHLAV